jgi:hypothetical protein
MDLDSTLPFPVVGPERPAPSSPQNLPAHATGGFICDDAAPSRIQTPLTTALDATRGLLRLTISHFIQTLNNAITRGALPRETRTLFQLPLESDRVPDLFTDADLLLWSQRIADGEKARTDAGGPPIAWPSAAEVATVRAQFSTQAAAQSSAKDATDREQGHVERLLPEVAAAVKDLWDTVEFHLRHEPTPASLRRRAREWGITYATRPGETPDEGTQTAGGAEKPAGGAGNPADGGTGQTCLAFKCELLFVSC